MAYNNAITSRLDELRSRNLPPTTTASESSSGYTTPSRYSGSFMPSHSQSVNDARASLQRRFTTDLSKMPNLTPIGQQPAQIQEAVDLPNTVSQIHLQGGPGSASRYRSCCSFFLHLPLYSLDWLTPFFHADPSQGPTRTLHPRPSIISLSLLPLSWLFYADPCAFAARKETLGA